MHYESRESLIKHLYHVFDNSRDDEFIRFEVEYAFIYLVSSPCYVLMQMNSRNLNPTPRSISNN